MLRSYFWLTFCVVMWGSNFIFGKILVMDFSPSMLTMLRLVIIVLFLVGLSFFYRFKQLPIRKIDWFMLVLLGVVGVFINQWSFFMGLRTADPTMAALILATTPILTGFLAAVFLKEKITIRMVIGSVVAIVGIFYVVTNGSLSQIQVDNGLIWIVLTMVTFALMIIMTRHLGQRIEPFSITLYSNIVGCIIALPFAFLVDKPVRAEGGVSGWALLIVTAIVVHGIATLIWNNHIRNVDASKASILSNLEPFVAMVVGLILLSKPITGIELLGSVFIVGGVVLSTYQPRMRFRRTIVGK